MTAWTLQGAVTAAEEFTANTAGTHFLCQFDNPCNTRVHYETTAPEIWDVTEGDVDIFVSGEL